MKRSKTHKTDSRAKKIFESFCPDNWSIQKPDEDYGIDYYVRVFEDDENEEATDIFFGIQLKGTKEFKKDNAFIKYNMEVNHLQFYYSKVSYPIFLVLVNINTEETCWLFIQKYINEKIIPTSKLSQQKNIILNIPKGNINPKYDLIERIASKNANYCNVLVNGSPSHDLLYDVKNITNNPSEKLNYLKNQYSELFNAETINAFELLEKDNNIKESKDSLYSVYNKTINDESNVEIHIKSIISLLFYYNWNNIEDRKKIFDFINEGLKLSEENQKLDYQHYFTSCKLENECFILQDNYHSLILLREKSIKFGDNSSLEVYDQELKKIYGLIYNKFEKLQSLLEETLANNELIIFTEILYSFIDLHLFNLMINLSIPYKQDVSELNIKISNLLDTFEILVDYFEERTLKYRYLDLKVRHKYFNNDETYKNALNEYERICKKDKSKSFLKRVEQLKVMTNYED